jgi:hypothetical protein
MKRARAMRSQWFDILAGAVPAASSARRTRFMTSEPQVPAPASSGGESGE